ncbi:MAG: sigma 54-interacting transcriptional regulator, partial [Myxococcales bacterium]|nr:sigma 54-interacting transcriptional regulator [Myxococcales bacterium]
FGHEKGAFSGADRSKAGLVEAAHGGTLVLDEVGELPLAAQAKLLRALDAKEVLRVGAVAPTPVDIRVVSATHRPLVAMVEDGRFRRDLLFRLSGLTLEVPPLRRRPEDLRALAERFFGARASQVTTDAWDLLLAHPWPGNVRELHHVVERAVLLAAGGPITATHLQLAPPPASSSPAPAPTVMTPSTGPLADDLRAIERDRILNALAAAGGNQTKAAAELGMPRRTFVSRLDAYGIPRPRKGR